MSPAAQYKTFQLLTREFLMRGVVVSAISFPPFSSRLMIFIVARTSDAINPPWSGQITPVASAALHPLPAQYPFVPSRLLTLSLASTFGLPDIIHSFCHRAKAHTCRQGNTYSRTPCFYTVISVNSMSNCCKRFRFKPFELNCSLPSSF